MSEFTQEARRVFEVNQGKPPSGYEWTLQTCLATIVPHVRWDRGAGAYTGALRLALPHETAALREASPRLAQILEQPGIT